jgi:chaperonin GroES
MPHLEGYEGLRVLGARVVIEMEPEETETPSGIILPTTSAEPKYEGRVVSTGSGARTEKGTIMPMEVKPGDRVIYSRMAGVPFEHQGKKYLIINERDIIAIIE